MKELYIEGLASRNGPESGAGSREVTGEAMAGVRTGRVLSRENLYLQSADAFTLCGRQYRHAR